MIEPSGDFSVIGWIDFSSEHREKVKTVIDFLHISDVVDELGIGTIRDCFSDTLFPGISTIQTRAKYFVTLPRLLREYQALQPHFRRKHPLADWLNEQENQCMKFLHTNHRTDPQNGIIGVEFAEKPGEVQRKPSSVYWNGLRLFGLVRTRRSLAEFLRKFANPDAPMLDLIEGTDDTKGDDRDAIDVTSPVVAPPTKDGQWKEHLTMHLSFEEATILAGQITTRVPFSLLGQILMDSEIRKEFVELSPDWQFHDFCDQASFIADLGEPLRTAVYDARDFWRLLEGAHIRYNVLLQARHGQPRQSELIEHLLKHLPEDKIGAVREKLMVNLSPISYRPNASNGEPNVGAAVQVRAVAKGDSDSPPSPAQQPKLGSSITNSLGMKFVWIPPGTFTMGSPREEADRVNNETPHKVTLTRGFYLGVHLVTQQQWQAVMGNNPSRFKGEKNLPVEGVSWEDCQEFIVKVREKENRHYRLPTEAEWEYACRAGTKTPFHVGFQLFPGQANFLGRQTTPIGSFRPNAFGLYDMHGNLYEWCEDWYGEYPDKAVVDPQGPPAGTERVVRGGCWGLGPGGCRSAYRRHFEANQRSDCFGFRLVLCSK